MAVSVRGSLQSLREGNRGRLLGLLREHGALHRAELARRAGVSRSTVSTIVGDLLEEGLVVEVAGASTDDGAGRISGRRSRLTLNPKAGIVLGLDFSADGVYGVVADLGHQVVSEGSRGHTPDLPWAECLDVAVDLANDLVARAGVGWPQVVGVGLGVPGPVNQQTGEVGASSHSLLWEGAHPANELSRRLKVPVVHDNTAHLGSLAEVAWGAAQGCRNVIYLKVSAGVSAGLVLDGRPFGGAIGATGAVGHLPVVPDGPVCSCGSRGCLELYTAVPALLDALRPVCGVLTLDEAISMATSGHRACRRVFADAGLTLGRGLAGVCNLLNPDLVVVGGDLARSGDLVLTPFRASLEQHALPIVWEHLRVVPGELGERAGAFGGVALVLRDTERLALPRAA